MRIRKTSQYIEGGASLSNVQGTSQSDGYSQEYINNLKYVEKYYPSSNIIWDYNTEKKFYTLPYTTGVHSYFITGVLSYASTALYNRILLLVTQTGTNVKIDQIVGPNNMTYTNDGVDLIVKQAVVQSTLHLYGVCYVLK